MASSMLRRPSESLLLRHSRGRSLLTFASLGSYGQDQRYSSIFPNGTRPPPLEMNLTPVYPSSTHSSSVSGSLHSAHSAPGNYYNPPPPPPSQSYLAPAYPAAPPNQAWPSHPSFSSSTLSAPPVHPGLHRSPSRLTTSHQQQQGYAPNRTASLRGAPQSSYSAGAGASGQAYPSYLPPPRPPQMPTLPPPPPASRHPPPSAPYPSVPANAPVRPPLPPPPHPAPSAPPAVGLTRRSSSLAALPVELLRGRGSRRGRGEDGFGGFAGMKGALHDEEEDFLGELV